MIRLGTRAQLEVPARMGNQWNMFYRLGGIGALSQGSKMARKGISGKFRID